MKLEGLRALLAGELRLQLRAPLTLVLMVLLPIASAPASMVVGQMLARGAERSFAAQNLPIAGPDELADWLQPTDGLHLALEGEEALVEVDLPPTEAREGGEPAVVHYRAAEARSRKAKERVIDVLERLRTAEVASAFAAIPGAPLPDEVVAVVRTDLDPRRDLGGLGRTVPLMAVFVMAVVATYVSLDLFTGEKERGTLESLLTTRIDRRVVIGAKFLLVVGAAVIAGLLMLASLVVSEKAGILSDDLGLHLTAPTLALTAVLLLPLAAILSAGLVALAAYAPDYKAGSMLVTPVMLVATGAAGVSALPDVELLGPVLLLPVGNAAVAIRDALSGTASPVGLLATMAVAAVQAGLALEGARRLLGRESVVLGGGATAGRRALGRFGPEAVGIFLLAVLLVWFLGQLAQGADLAWGMVFTQVVLMGGVAVLGLLWLGIPLRAGLALRRPAVSDVFLGAIAGATAPGLSTLAERIQAPLLPAPASFAEQMLDALATGRPLWLILLLFAAMPAVFEESLFRGTLLGLLRRSLSPTLSCLAVGLMFGFVHLAAPRIFPTGVLGVLFSVALLRSGSLVVPITAHMVNNGLLLTAATQGWLVEEPPWWVSVLLAAISVAAVAAMGRPRLTSR